MRMNYMLTGSTGLLIAVYALLRGQRPHGRRMASVAHTDQGKTAVTIYFILGFPKRVFPPVPSRASGGVHTSHLFIACAGRVSAQDPPIGDPCRGVHGGR